MLQFFSSHEQRVSSFQKISYFFIVAVILFFIFPIFSAQAKKCEGIFNCFGLHDVASIANFEAISPTNTLPIIIGKIVQVILSFVGVIFMLLVIYASFMWMVSGGNDEKVGKAKKLIFTASIGLLLILSGYIITRLVVDTLITAIEST